MNKKALKSLEAKFRLKSGVIEGFLKAKGWDALKVKELLGVKNEPQVYQTLAGTIEPSMNFLHRFCSLTGLKLEDVVETVFE